MTTHSHRSGRLMVLGLTALAILAGGVIVLVVLAGQKRITAENSSVYSQLAPTQPPATETPLAAEKASETSAELPIDAVSAKDDLALLTPLVDPVSAKDSQVPPPTRVQATDEPLAESVQVPDDPPTGPILAKPAKDTTRILEPLNQDGSANFVAALDGGYREEIDPQRNAAVLLLQILPTPGREDIRRRIFEGLGITGPAQGQSFVRPRDFLQARGLASSSQETAIATDDEDDDKPTEEERKFMDLLAVLGRKAWSASEHPEVAGWLEENRQALEAITIAVDRKRFYVPMVSGREPEILPKVSLPYLTPMREAGRALAARATLRLADGYVEGSIADVMTLYRLGRLLRQPPILLCQFTGNALETQANETTSVLADHPLLTSAHARLMIEQMRKLPGWPVADRTASMGERFMFLDALQVAQRQPQWKIVAESLFLRDMDKIAGQAPPHDLPMIVDFRLVMQAIQNTFDQAEKALAKSDYALAMRALEALEKEARTLREASIGKAFDPAFIQQYQAADDLEKRRLMTPVVSAMATRSIVPLMMTRLRNEYLLRMKTGLGEISLALTGFQRDTGDFPKRLDELSPQYLRPIPRDVFVDRSLSFSRLKDGGVMVYSVGPNLQDDGGNPHGNRDLVLRMNLPSPQ